jgi:hypothetical protein
MKIELDYSKIEDVSLADVDTRDFPDFCDAFIECATYDGREMTEAEIDVLNEDRDYVYEKVLDYLF